MTKEQLQSVEDLIKPGSFETDYEVQHELGRGRFAVVKRCICRKTGKKFAAKIVKKSRSNSHGRSGREQLLMEIYILNKSTHPKMVRLFDVFETRGEMQLILEYAEGGDLHRHCIEIDVARTEKEICYLIQQILEAVRYLHGEKIVHLDLKPDNILLSKKDEVFPEVRLIDFGLSRSLEGPYSQFDMVGTAEYVSPEVLAFEPIDYGSDMWSIGVVTYVLLSGISPFAGDEVMETYANIGMVEYDFDCEEFDDISDDAIDFIEKLLLRDPKKRMSSRDAVEHAWIKQLEGGLSTKDVMDAQQAKHEQLANDISIEPIGEEGFVSSSESDSSQSLEKSDEVLKDEQPENVNKDKSKNENKKTLNDECKIENEKNKSKEDAKVVKENHINKEENDETAPKVVEAAVEVTQKVETTPDKDENAKGTPKQVNGEIFKVEGTPKKTINDTKSKMFQKSNKETPISDKFSKGKSNKSFDVGFLSNNEKKSLSSSKGGSKSEPATNIKTTEEKEKSSAGNSEDIRRPSEELEKEVSPEKNNIEEDISKIKPSEEETEKVPENLEVKKPPSFKKKSPVPIPPKKQFGEPQKSTPVTKNKTSGIAAKMGKFGKPEDSSPKPLKNASKFEKKSTPEKRSNESQDEKSLDLPLKKTNDDADKTKDIKPDESSKVKETTNEEVKEVDTKAKTETGSFALGNDSKQKSKVTPPVASKPKSPPPVANKPKSPTCLSRTTSPVPDTSKEPPTVANKPTSSSRTQSPVLDNSRDPVAVVNKPTSSSRTQSPEPDNSRDPAAVVNKPTSSSRTQSPVSDNSKEPPNRPTSPPVKTKPKNKKPPEVKAKPPEVKSKPPNPKKTESKITETEPNKPEEEASRVGSPTKSNETESQLIQPKATVGTGLKFSLTLGGGSKKLNIGPLVSLANKDDVKAKEVEKNVLPNIAVSGSPILEDVPHTENEKPSEHSRIRPPLKDTRGKNDSVSRRRSNTNQGGEESTHRKTYRRLYVTKVRNSKLYEQTFDITNEAAKIVQRVDKDVLKVEVKLKSTDLRLLP